VSATRRVRAADARWKLSCARQNHEARRRWVSLAPVVQRSDSWVLLEGPSMVIRSGAGEVVYSERGMDEFWSVSAWGAVKWSRPSSLRHGRG